MKAKYLSRDVARAMANDFQHLSGQPFDALHTVARVVAGPYSRILQWGFVSALMNGRPAPPIPNDRYDALVVSLAPDVPAGFLIESLRSFLDTAGMEYDMTRYRKAALAVGY